MSGEPFGVSRREMLNRCGMGFGALAFGSLMGQLCGQAAESEQISLNPLTTKVPHFPAKATRVIHLFLNGGMSQVDTFDPKPALEQYMIIELSRAVRSPS